MSNKKFNFDGVLKFFHKFEYILSLILAILIGAILAVAVIRLIVFSYILIFSNVLEPTDIDYQDFNDIFGKIMTLLITIEFMNSILSVLKTGELKGLVKDVTLITGLAIARKLIIFDYSHTEPLVIIAMGIVLVSVGIFYFLVRTDSISRFLPKKDEDPDIG